MNEFEFQLIDRINVIKDFLSTQGIENVYIAFSGGKDSTCLSKLLDIALPGNSIPRVYVDTGIAYKIQNDYVKSLCNKDKRFVYISPVGNIKQNLEMYGYPFKSKIHSRFVDWFNHYEKQEFVIKYITGEYFSFNYKCDIHFLHHFKKPGEFNFSANCCVIMKEKPLNNWGVSHHRPICITGMRRSEGGNRAKLPCITKSYGVIKSFNPLAPLNDDFMDWFIKDYNIELCSLYYAPYNYHRTGCKGCPFNWNLQNDLLCLKKFQPMEFKHCLQLWKYPYQEYIRTGFRLTIDFYSES